MDWNAEYGRSIVYAKKHLADSAIFAYNTNIDAVKYLRGRDVKRITLPFSSELKECMRTGGQAEVQISKRELRFLIDELGYDDSRIGGQAGNMANAASHLGVECFVHANAKSRRLLSLFDKPDKIFIACNSGFENPGRISCGGEEPVHYVMEFKKGDMMDGRVIPNSNRFIASFNPVGEMEIDGSFKRNILRRIATIDRALISGFHMMEEGSDYMGRIDRIKAQIGEWKILNPDLKVHMEFGHFQSRKVLKYVISEMLPVCDSAGFNEEELDAINKARGYEFKNKIKACESICALTGSAVFHCKDYSFVLSRGENRLNSLLFASLLAACRMATDRNASFRDALKFMRSGIKINSRGLEEIGKLSRIKTGFRADFAPALVVDKPKSTVGIGDCFTACYFLTK